MTAVVATNQTILVVGGGISGMTAALEAAECGKDVVLVEKTRAWADGFHNSINTFPSCAIQPAAWRSISGACGATSVSAC